MRSTFFAALLAAFLCAFLPGCCGNDTVDDGPRVAGDFPDVEEVEGEPIDGACLRIPLVNCKICIGASCDELDSPLSPATFRQPVRVRRVRAPAPPAAAEWYPCEPVPGEALPMPQAEYSAPDPCEGIHGSASDGGMIVDNDCAYGVPPAVAAAGRSDFRPVAHRLGDWCHGGACDVPAAR